MSLDLPAAWMGLAVALGCGLLIGLDRERRKGQGPDREPAGIRSFVLAALTGGIAQVLQEPWLVLAGAVLIIALGGVAYWKSRSDDPGLTTELALFSTYLIGVLSVRDPAMGAACGTSVAALLAARNWLHRLSTQSLSEHEVQNLILLAAIVLVVLPLTPAAPLPWLGGFNPRTIVGLVALILSLQAAGHVATRLLGPRLGLLASGFFSGFVSSTATIATMGARARPRPDTTKAHAAAGVLSSAATWIQSMLLLAALVPMATLRLVPLAAAGALVALAFGLSLFWTTRAEGAPIVAPDDSPLRLREALIVALLLSVVALAVNAAASRFGQAGLYASVALAALADAHAPIASAGALHASGSIDAAALQRCLLLAIAVNAVTRAIVAFVAGGRRFGAWVLAGLATSLSAAALVAWVW